MSSSHYLRIRRTGICFVLAGIAGCSSTPKAPEEKPKVVNCSTTREYITVLQYLRQKESEKGNEKAAQDLARQVANGCTGAAGRFIRVVEILLATGLDGKQAMKIGLELSAAEDAKVDTFIFQFRTAFLASELDLSFEMALNLARTLSVGFGGNVERAKRDFVEVAKFCTDPRNAMDLPKPRCAEIANELAIAGQDYENGKIVDGFREVYLKASNPKGMNLAKPEALNLAREIAKAGEKGPENFLEAYEFATSKSGLGLDHGQALDFSKKMSSQSKLKAQDKSG